MKIATSLTAKGTPRRRAYNEKAHGEPNRLGSLLGEGIRRLLQGLLDLDGRPGHWHRLRVVLCRQRQALQRPPLRL